MTKALFSILAGIFFYTMNASASTNTAETVTIQWKVAAGDNYVYQVSAGKTNGIEIRLLFKSKQITMTDRQWAGGFEGFKKVCEESLATLKRQSKQTHRKDDLYRLAISLSAPTGEAELTAPLETFFDMFKSDSSLGRIVATLSEGQPKMYRIIDSPGPMKAMAPK
jgi:hypothetical protein